MRCGKTLGGVRVGEQCGRVGGEKAFKKQGGGYLIDDVFAVEASGAAGGASGVAGVVEQGVGVVGGQALVEELVGEMWVGWVGEFGQGLGEGLGLGGLGAGRAVGMEGIADKDELDFVLADEAGDGFEVGAEA